MNANIEPINESIKVVAAFSGGKITPLIFSWKNRRYEKLTVTSRWIETEGQTRWVHFTITTPDQANLYEVKFNNINFRWVLVSVWSN